MQDIKQALCSAMYRFVSDKINELKPRAWGQEDWFGFRDKEDMMTSIKNQWDDAAWALTELSHWGFEKRYYFDCFVIDKLNDEYDTPIHCIIDDDGNKRYFTLEYSNSTDKMFGSIIEVNRTVEMVEVVTWKEV